MRTHNLRIFMKIGDGCRPVYRLLCAGGRDSDQIPRSRKGQDRPGLPVASRIDIVLFYQIDIVAIRG